MSTHLNFCAKITESCIYTGGLDTGLCGRLHGPHQRIKLGIKVQRPGAVDDPPLDVGAKVHLDHVVKLQDRLVARVGAVVGGHVVARTAGRKGEAGLQPVLVDQLAGRALQLLADVDHPHARLDPLLNVLPRLSVRLGCLKRNDSTHHNPGTDMAIYEKNN